MEEELDITKLQQKLQLEFPDAVHQLVLFRRQWLQRLPSTYITWPPEELLRIYDVQRWMYRFIKNPWHDESRTRQDSVFVTELVLRIEHSLRGVSEADLSDELMELCASLCTQPRFHAAELAQCDVWSLYETTRTPDMAEEQKSIKLYEKPSMLSYSGCTGYRTWEAALALAQRIAARWIPQNLLAGKKMLELGAGTGLLSFLCASSGGARRVVATDGNEDAIRRLLLSSKVNGFGSLDDTSHLRFGAYVWDEPFEYNIIGEELEQGPFDLVLAADVTYDPESAPALVATIRRLLEVNPATVVIVSSTLRNQATFNRFLEECRQSRLATDVFECICIPIPEQRCFFRTNQESVMIVSITPEHNALNENELVEAVCSC